MMFSLPMAGVEVHGTVRDIYNRPLAGVLVRTSSGERSLLSDEKGEFVFDVAAGETFLELYFESPQHYLEKRTVVLKEITPDLKVYLIPLNLLREDVTVTALNESQKTIAIPFAQNVVSKSGIMESQPETIVQALQNSPGVHFIGKGGIAVTPSIRGLARRRILLLAAGARITSDRSAGAAAQFYPPELVQQIEVVRSAASVLYGSDAIGGVIQIIPRNAQNAEPGFAALNISGHSADQKLNGGFALNQKFGSYSVFSAMQISQADDYSAAGARVFNSGYRYYTGNLFAGYETEKRSFSLSFLKSAGRDIGKPERANDPAISSFYPRENINLLNITYCENYPKASSSLNFSFFLNPNDYELDKIKQANKQVDISKNNALDFGVRTTLKKSLSSNLSYQFGVDYYGRTNVDMENETWKNGFLSNRSFPVENGRRNDLGMYAMLDYSGLAAFDLLAGARLGAFFRNAVSDGVLLKKSSWAPAFFLGITRKIKDTFTMFFNAGTAYRQPSLSEAFYTGITGRSSIVGNPDLKPEKSLNLDAGLKIHCKNIFLGTYFFQYSVRNMIEKFQLSDTSYTYENIEQGLIRGLELEFQFYPLKKLELFGNAFYYNGRSTISEKPVNDIPSAKLFLGAKFWLGRFWSEVNWLASAAVKHPGPAETAIPAFSVTTVKAGCYCSNRLFVFFKIANLFDRVYFANADPDIPPAKGLDFSLGLNLNF